MVPPCLPCGDVLATRNLDTHAGEGERRYMARESGCNQPTSTTATTDIRSASTATGLAVASRPPSPNEGAYLADLPPPLRADQSGFDLVNTTPPPTRPERVN
ncbi:hypothetical protein TEQG_07686 [Trichophyton equinum CBS 127.97]|uniref:Uncharacterized protein n=1 Tax=Trichophyton equinum (strain ATCC MYA-4606 / CBS 127.97) TaxID=559882 RepID=F2Q3L0_TRIEC|nr:hypothetical protein TEQG_07686 [Trichophyton equinum CBS 127.97]